MAIPIRWQLSSTASLAGGAVQGVCQPSFGRRAPSWSRGAAAASRRNVGYPGPTLGRHPTQGAAQMCGQILALEIAIASPRER
jgi:hypothetical protein